MVTLRDESVVNTLIELFVGLGFVMIGGLLTGGAFVVNV